MSLFLFLFLFVSLPLSHSVLECETMHTLLCTPGAFNESYLTEITTQTHTDGQKEPHTHPQHNDNNDIVLIFPRLHTFNEL